MEIFEGVPFTDIYVTREGLCRYTDYSGRPREDYGFSGKDGYRTIKHKSGKFYSIHRLVGRVFVPNECPSYFTTIHHKDHNRSNNHFENLEWVRRQINASLRKNVALVKKTKGGYYKVKFRFDNKVYQRPRIFKNYQQCLEEAKRYKDQLITEKKNFLIECERNGDDPNKGKCCCKCGQLLPKLFSN